MFERFPDLRVAFVETEADWIAPAIRKLDRRLEWGDDWTGWAQTLQRMRQFTGSAREYWASNCYAGISPFTEDQVPLDELARPSAEYEPFAIGCDNAMFGVDYPHFESVFPETEVQVDALVQHPSITRGGGPQDPLRERGARVRLRSGATGARHRAGRLRGRRAAHVRSLTRLA